MKSSFSSTFPIVYRTIRMYLISYSVRKKFQVWILSTILFSWHNTGDEPKQQHQTVFAFFLEWPSSKILCDYRNTNVPGLILKYFFKQNHKYGFWTFYYWFHRNTKNETRIAEMPFIWTMQNEILKWVALSWSCWYFWSIPNHYATFGQ